MPSELTDKQLQKKQRKAQKRKAQKARKLQARQEELIDTQKAPADALSRRDRSSLGIENENDHFDRLDDEYWARCDARPNPPQLTGKTPQKEQREAKKNAARKARKLQERKEKSLTVKQTAPATATPRKCAIRQWSYDADDYYDDLDPRRMPRHLLDKDWLAKQDKSREERETYKRQRVRRLIDEGEAKVHFNERRERYHCMKDHPGKYCSECNPRRHDPVPDHACCEDDIDENDEVPVYCQVCDTYMALSDEEAEMSDSWSDKGSDWGREPSPTYSDLWWDEEEKDEVTESIKRSIERVNAAHKALQASLESEPSQKVKIGGLVGRWTLYNLKVCPKTWEGTDERYRLEFSKAAASRQVPRQNRSKASWDHPSFIRWEIGMAIGDTAPFQIPEHASLNSIPIVLFRSEKRHHIDIHAEITFLGSDCLRLRVPRSIVYPDGIESNDKKSEPMIEFAGLRWTEQDQEKAKQAEAKIRAELARKNAYSPRSPKWYDFDNGCPSEYEFQFY